MVERTEASSSGEIQSPQPGPELQIKPKQSPCHNGHHFKVAPFEENKEVANCFQEALQAETKEQQEFQPTYIPLGGEKIYSSLVRSDALRSHKIGKYTGLTESKMDKILVKIQKNKEFGQDLGLRADEDNYGDVCKEANYNASKEENHPNYIATYAKENTESFKEANRLALDLANHLNSKMLIDEKKESTVRKVQFAEAEAEAKAGVEENDPNYIEYEDEVWGGEKEVEKIESKNRWTFFKKFW